MKLKKNGILKLKFLHWRYRCKKKLSKKMHLLHQGLQKDQKPDSLLHCMSPQKLQKRKDNTQELASHMSSNTPQQEMRSWGLRNSPRIGAFYFILFCVCVIAWTKNWWVRDLATSKKQQHCVCACIIIFILILFFVYFLFLCDLMSWGSCNSPRTAACCYICVCAWLNGS